MKKIIPILPFFLLLVGLGHGHLFGQGPPVLNLDKYELEDAIKAITIKLSITGNKVETKTEFEYLLKKHPNVAAFKYNLGVISAALEDWDEADKWFKEYVSSPGATSEKLKQANAELASITKIKALSPKERNDRSFKIALAKIELHADNGEFSEAFKLLRFYLVTQKQNPEYIRFFDRLTNGEKAETYLTQLSTNFDAFSSKELLSRSATIWDSYSPKAYPEIIFPLAFALVKVQEKPVVLDPRAILMPAGKCLSAVTAATRNLVNVEKESVKFQGKTVYKLASGERLLASRADEANLTLLLNSKIATIQNNQRTFLAIPESQSGKLIGRSTLLLHQSDNKEKLFNITGSGPKEYQIDAGGIRDIIETDNNNLAVATDDSITMFAPNGEEITAFPIPFRKVQKLMKGPNDSLLFITDKSLSKLTKINDEYRILDLTIGAFSDLSGFNADNSATMCTANQDRYEVSKISEPSIGEFSSDREMAGKLLDEIAKFNDIEAYDKAILKAVKLVQHFPESESSAITVRYLLQKLISKQ